MRRFVEILRESLPREIFSFNEAAAVAMSDAAGSARREGRRAVRLLLHRMARSGVVVRCCRGIYAFGPAYRRGGMDLLALACRMKRPSYVTMESALEFHGLIPEMVHVVQCATPTRGGLFETPFGSVRYHVIRDFSYDDVRSLDSSDPGSMEVLVADPAKAVRDIALRQGKRWIGSGDLMEDLRLAFETRGAEKIFLRELGAYRGVVWSRGSRVPRAHRRKA